MNVVPHEISKKLNKYLRAAVSLEFALKMTENNDLSFGTSLLRRFSTGANVIGIDVTNNHVRENFRNFRITESWRELAFQPQKCVDFPLAGPNYNYPITGGVGLTS